MPNPKEIKQRIDTTLKAWEENAPTAKLYNRKRPVECHG